MNRFLVLLLLVFSTLTLLAEKHDSLSQKRYQLNEIVVRSFKQEKNVRKLPVAVTQLMGMSLRNQQLTSAKEISGLVPNLFIPDYGSKYTSPVYIRGVGNKTGSPAVGLYVDGIPYFEKSAFDFDWYEIENVEVYRGPQGTLYGRNTMGGLLNVTTRSPLKYQYTDFRVGAGSYHQYLASVAHYGKVAPNCGYSILGKYSHDGGFFKNTYRDERADEGWSANVRAKMEWAFQPRWMLMVTTGFDRSVQGANAYAPLNTETEELGAIAFDGVSSYQRTLSTTGISLRYEGEHFQVSYQQALQYTRDKLRQDQDFTPADRVNSLVGQEQWMTSGELNLKHQVGTHYRGLTGAFGFYQLMEKSVTTEYARFKTFKDDELPAKGVAVYHQSTIDHLGWEGLTMTLGLRYDHEHSARDYASRKNERKNEDKPEKQHTRRRFTQFVPKMALQYMFPAGGQVYTSVSKGYKTGGFNTSFNEEDEKSYGPESSWNYEIGAKHPFWDQRFYAEVAFFWIDWKDQQIQQKVDAGGFMIRNAGKSVSRGMEFSMRCNPLNGLTLTASYGYTHAEFRRYRQSAQKDFSGNYLPMVPRHTVGGSVNYARSLRACFFDRYQLGLNFSGQGTTYWHEDNQRMQPFYALLNATASVSKKKLTLDFWVKNLTDTDYVSYLFKSGSGTFAQRGKPFNMGITVSYKR